MGYIKKTDVLRILFLIPILAKAPAGEVPVGGFEVSAAYPAAFGAVNAASPAEGFAVNAEVPADENGHTPWTGQDRPGSTKSAPVQTHSIRTGTSEEGETSGANTYLADWSNEIKQVDEEENEQQEIITFEFKEENEIENGIKAPSRKDKSISNQEEDKGMYTKYTQTSDKLRGIRTPVRINRTAQTVKSSGKKTSALLDLTSPEVDITTQDIKQTPFGWTASEAKAEIPESNPPKQNPETVTPELNKEQQRKKSWQEVNLD